MSLQVWLPLNGNLNNQGLSDVIVTNNGATVDNSGKIGKCYNFDGVDDYIDIAGVNLGNNWSYGCWFKEASSTRTWSGMIILNTNGGDADMQLGFYSNPSTSKIQSTANGQYNSGISHTFDGQWHHLFATFDGSNLKTYRDGILINTKAITTALLPRTKLTLGARCRGSSYDCRWLGSMNDFRLYDHCLSPKEVEEISKGLVLHYKLDNNGLGGENILTNSSGWQGITNWNGVVSTGSENNLPYLIAKRTDTTSTSRTFCTHSAITSYVSSWISGDKFTISGYYKIPSSETQTTTANMFIRWTLSSGTSDTGFNIVTSSAIKNTWTKFQYTYSVPANYAGGAANFYLSAFSAGGIATVYWKNIKLEKGEYATQWSPAKTDTIYPIGYNSIIYDSSGYNNNGTIVGSLQTKTPSVRYDCCSYIADGNVTYITTPVLNLPGDQITMNFWFKSSNKSATGGYHMPLESTNSGYYEISITSSGAFRGGLYVGGSRKVDNGTSSKLTDGNWHMCTMTYDGTTIKRYVDAVSEKDTTATGALLTSSSFVIGHYGSNTSYASKEVYESDIRLYTTALTTTQVKELYNTSMSIDSFGNIHAREVVEI